MKIDLLVLNFCFKEKMFGDAKDVKIDEQFDKTGHRRKMLRDALIDLSQS